MKTSVNEAYYNKWNNKNKKTHTSSGSTSDENKGRYVNISVKRFSQGDDDNKKGYINIILSNILEEDAEKIKNQVISGGIVGKYKTYNKGKVFVLPGISFNISEDKWVKWVKIALPRIVTILEGSTNCKYFKVANLEESLIEAIHNTPKEESRIRAEHSLKELKEAIYKAISENRWDDAAVMYKKAINLMARVYGFQLAPNNVKQIYTQARKAGIEPTDKGAATNSYWPDGTEKFWPTFVRSAYSWKKDFGRTIKDEPKMQYLYTSTNTTEASADVVNDRLKSQGFNSLKDVSPQQREVIKNGGVKNAFRGVGYDISDTEGPDDFFLTPGLSNNLEGTLTDAAVKDNEMWLKKMQDMKKQNGSLELNDFDRKKELASTEEGVAELYLEALNELCSSIWKNLNVTVVQNDDKVLAYLYTIEEIAKAKILASGWKNMTNVNKIAQMVTAAIAISTIGEDRTRKMYDLSMVNIFKSLEECEQTVFGIADSILSSLSFKTNYYREFSSMNENRLFKFFNLLERMDNMHNEDYKYELSNGLVHRPSNKVIMDFLGELGLKFENNSDETIS